MASAAQVLAWRLRPGRLEDFIKIAARADKILRNFGATTRTLNNAVAGDQAGTILYVIECADINAFGALQSRMQTDKEWQAFLAEVDSDRNPTADLVGSSLYAEVAVGSEGSCRTGRVRRQRPQPSGRRSGWG